jgi:hypothetical protein
MKICAVALSMFVVSCGSDNSLESGLSASATLVRFQNTEAIAVHPNHTNNNYIRPGIMNLLHRAADAVVAKFPGTATLYVNDIAGPGGISPAGHPAGSHQGGVNIDISYYRNQGIHYGEVCSSQGQYHCVSAPNNLDAERTALFLKEVQAGGPQIIAVDGRIGPALKAVVPDLNVYAEATNLGSGWFLHHHHHTHIRFLSDVSVAPSPGTTTSDLEPSTDPEPSASTGESDTTAVSNDGSCEGAFGTIYPNGQVTTYNGGTYTCNNGQWDQS